MASPVKRLTTTRSVVTARAASTRNGCAKTAASKAIQTIPGRNVDGKRGPFLSCRCAVIVDADNNRVGGRWMQPKAVPVGNWLKVTFRFRYLGVLSWFSLHAWPR